MKERKIKPGETIILKPGTLFGKLNPSTPSRALIKSKKVKLIQFVTDDLKTGICQLSMDKTMYYFNMRYIKEYNNEKNI